MRCCDDVHYSDQSQSAIYMYCTWLGVMLKSGMLVLKVLIVYMRPCFVPVCRNGCGRFAATMVLATERHVMLANQVAVNLSGNVR